MATAVARKPFEIISPYGDFAPGITLSSTTVRWTDIIDFETAHPGPRCWDLAYAVYRWAPLMLLVRRSESRRAQRANPPYAHFS